MSKVNQENEIKFGNHSILSGVPIKREISILEDETGLIVKLKKEEEFNTSLWKGIKISSLKKFLALYRSVTYWYSPHFGNNESDIPERTLLILFERKDGKFGVLAPLINKGYNIYFNGREDGLEVIADNNCDSGNVKTLTCFYLSIGKNPYHLLSDAARSIIDYIGVGKLRQEKSLPEWVDYLGYCTWNTFYHKITQENCTEMLNFLTRKRKIPIGFFLLDDGWQKSRHRTLLDKGVNKNKFPDGLKKFVSQVKRNFGIKYFILWHAMQGYWHGISLHHGKYRKKINLIKNVPHYGPSNPKISNFYQKLYRGYLFICKIINHHFGVILPEDIEPFWDDFHGWMAESGVDGVKVDNQAGTEYHYYNLGYQANVMRDLHGKLEKSVSKHFSKLSIINCMSQNTNIYYQLKDSNITRNSDDYFPNSETLQCQHVLQNAYNDLWCAQFSLPDWDMFQTANKLGWGEYQAATRAISGSPIYFADDFKEVNPEIISKLVLPNGKVLRCKDTALPCRENLFKNPTKQGRALKLFNFNQFNAVLGIFNVMVNNSTDIFYSPSDMEGLDSNCSYVVYSYRKKSLKVMEYLEKEELELRIKGFELLTIAVINDGFAPIGLLEKYNPGGVFEDIGTINNNLVMNLKYGGVLGVYSVRKPREILLDGKSLEFEYNPKEKFLKIDVPKIERPIIEIFCP